MCDYLYKIVVVGDSGVGKTNIITRFTSNEFFMNNKATIGVEFGHAEVEQPDSTIVKLQIWDTAGQDRFRAITSGYYRGAAGAIIVFDITKMITFKNVQRWADELKYFCSDDIPILLLGNKVDVEYLREVSTDVAVAYAKEHGFMYMETSALSGENVERAINSLSNTIYQKEKTQTNIHSSSDIDISEGEKIIIGDSKSSARKGKSCC